MMGVPYQKEANDTIMIKYMQSFGNIIPSTRYKSFEQLCTRESPQHVAHIPVGCNANSAEKVLPCGIKHCRYTSKTLTEYERHRSHCHAKPIALQESVADDKSTASGLPGYSVSGLPPVLGAKKKTQKRKISSAEEGPPEEEPAALAEGMDEEGRGEQGDGGKRPRIETGPRVMTGQHTDATLKQLMPLMCQPSHISLRQDEVLRFMFQARYDHRTNDAQTALEASKLSKLPMSMRQITKDGPFGAGATQEDKDAALEKVLIWAWAKHTFLTGEERPAWASV